MVTKIKALACSHPAVCCALVRSHMFSKVSPAQDSRGWGVPWGCGKEPENKRLCMKCPPLLCSTPRIFLYIFVYLLSQMYHYFINMWFFFLFFLSELRQLLWICKLPQPEHCTQHCITLCPGEPAVQWTAWPRGARGALALRKSK